MEHDFMRAKTERIILVSHNIFGFRCLKRLVYTGFNVVCVISRKTGDKLSDFCEDFSSLCSLYDIPFVSTDNINDEDILRLIRFIKPDVILITGWSQLIKDDFFDLAPLGVFGTHPSLLPKNRGRAAIPWQILNGEKESGVTLFRIPQGEHPPDSGDIYAQDKFTVDPHETSFGFYEKACLAMERIIDTQLDMILKGKVKGRKQDESKATYLEKRTPQDSLIDWSKDAEYIERFIRAMSPPYPPAYTFCAGEKVIFMPQPIERIREVKCKYENKKGI